MIPARTAITIAALFLAALMAIFVMPWKPGVDEPPTLIVEASYPGATAAVVEQTMAAPIEQQINGVEHLRQMRSRCGHDGSYTLELSFEPGTDLNLAQTLVQNRVGLALPILPAVVQRRGVTTLKRSPRLLMLIAVVSPDARFDSRYLGTYATVQLKDELARLPGIAEVSTVGRHELAARVRLDPDKLAMHNLTPADVMRALEQHDLKPTAAQSAGPGDASDLALGAREGRMQPDDLNAIVIKSDAEGHVTRLRDVQSGLELGIGQAGYTSLDVKAAAVLAIYPLSQAQPRDVSAMVQARLAELRGRFPDGVDVFAEFDFSREPTAEAPGYLVVDVDPPAGASADEKARLMVRAEQSLRRIPGVRNVMALPEQPFDRDRDQPCVVTRLGPENGAPVDRERLIRVMREGFSDVRPPAGIRVRDLLGPARSRRFGYPIDFAIQGSDLRRVQELADQLVARMSQDRRLTDVWAGPRPVHTLAVDIDRAKAVSLGIALADISAMLEAALRPAQAGNIRLFGRTYPVRVQVGSGGPTDVDVLSRLRVRNDKGAMVLLRTVAAFRREDQPVRLERLDLLPAVSITASPAGGLTPAEARFVCEQLAAELLAKQQPSGCRLVWPREMPAARAPAVPR